jgi:hypothetical protein
MQGNSTVIPLLFDMVSTKNKTLIISWDIHLQTMSAIQQYAVHYKYMLQKRVKDYRNKWHSHIIRLDSSRLIQKVKNHQPEGQRNVGQPRR